MHLSLEGLRQRGEAAHRAAQLCQPQHSVEDEDEDDGQGEGRRGDEASLSSRLFVPADEGGEGEEDDKEEEDIEDVYKKK
jgi:hypothetical protein